MKTSKAADILKRMTGRPHFTAACLAILTLLGAANGAAQQPPAASPAPGEATFLVFMGGREVGREQVNVSRTASGWTITSTGRHAPPLNFTINRFEITYAPDWQPLELKIDAAANNDRLGLTTSFATTTAINEITQRGVTNSKNDQVSARTIVLPNNFFAAYEALAVRLAGSEPGAELPIYVAPQTEIRCRVRSVGTSTYETPAGAIATRKYAVTFQNPNGPVEAEISIDDRNRLARLEIAAASLSVTRLDLAGVATRQHTHRNPTDADVRIPAAGFGLAGTVTTPPAQGRLKHPAIVLVAGAGVTDRDGAAGGVPILAQLAGQLADLGFVVVRYDKRGIGQSGGRTETVTLQDYADDAVAVVKWVARRKDVDEKRIALAGYDEGATVGLLAAAREKKIASLVLVAAPGLSGRELVLEQQSALLKAANVADAERTDKIELQKKILEAAATEKGWETIPPDVRRAVDTPWYRSLLTFDPAKVVPRVKQPILLLQPELDAQLGSHHGTRLAELGKARKDAPATELKPLPALNHSLLPAGAADAKAIGPDVAKAIAAWLTALR
jgi:alpha/beta superfamily hydrolase